MLYAVHMKVSGCGTFAVVVDVNEGHKIRAKYTKTKTKIKQAHTKNNQHKEKEINLSLNIKWIFIYNKTDL